MMKTTLLYSGGLDSTVLMYLLLSQGHKVTALSVDYGQRHRREIDAAAALCDLKGVSHVVADIRSISPLLCGSSLTGDGELSGKATIVPNRNMLFLSLAAAHAVSTGAQAVAYAPHAGDAEIYPDCRPAFCRAAGDMLLSGCGVSLLTPFLPIQKWQIVQEGKRLRVPFQKTWTCYAGGENPCGDCGSCIERDVAFAIASDYQSMLDAMKEVK